MKNYNSWGNYPKVKIDSQHVYHVYPDSFSFPETDGLSSDSPLFLAYAQGRSYGDVCLNENGILLDTKHLDHFIEYDKEKGILRCEAGVTFANILQLITPHNWFLPVTPSTKKISVGGAIANDIHGKNQHNAGTFGRYILKFELLRSNGEHLICSPTENSELFNATIGGLGLTGLISWVEFSLKKVNGFEMEQESFRFNNISEFLKISEESSKDWEYISAWIDGSAGGTKLGRGIITRANHTNSNIKAKFKSSIFSIPFYLPSFTLNKYIVRLLNNIYFKKPIKQVSKKNCDAYFYSSDKISHWNKLFGKKGFMQYQCLIPLEHSEQALTEMLNIITVKGSASFLSVLKEFSDIQSPGLLSFPRKGLTLAFDFSNRGQQTLELLNTLDNITIKYNGAIYPAKDARMSSGSFLKYYPKWSNFKKFIDPHFSSNFLRRVINDSESN